MSAQIRLTRENAFILKIRKLKVFLDDSQVGEVGNDQTIEFEALPGEHTLQVTLDLQSSPKMQFSVQDGAVVEFLCSTAVKGDSLGEKLGNIFSYRRKKESLVLQKV